MSIPVRPANGQHTLVVSSPPSVVTYVFSPDGIRTSFGTLAWYDDPAPLHAQHGVIGITFYDDGTFVAVNGSESYAGTWN